MIRFAALLACCLFCQITHGVAAPNAKPKDPPTNSELIVGVWEVTKDNGKPLKSPVFWEFCANGTMRAFGRPGSKLNEHRFYSVIDNKLKLISKEPGETDLIWSIQILTEKNMTAGTTEFIKRP